MKIKWLGHSCFLLTESTGTTIVTDPYGDVGYSLPPVSADYVTVSHDHYDHSNVSAVGGNPEVFTEPGLYERNGVTIRGISTYHDENEGKDRGENTVYKFRMDGLDICHMGDIGCEYTSQLIESLLPVNVLLLPVGGTYTIDAEQAKEYVDMLMPDIVIPMHYKTKSLNIDIDRAEPFLRMFDDEYVTISESDTVELERDDMDEEITKVILLRRKK